jgi:hypothetical protein
MNEIRLYQKKLSWKVVYNFVIYKYSNNCATVILPCFVFLFLKTNFISMKARNNRDSNLNVCILSQFNKYSVNE